MREEDATIHEGCGNVFADLGVANADEMQLKAQMVLELRRLMAARSLSQTATAKLVGIGQTDLSELLAGALRGYSVDQLMKMLTAFDQEITITSRPRTSKGTATISFAALTTEAL